MVQATLAAQLQNMTPTDQESVAIATLVAAYGTFASTASAGPSVITPAAITAGKAAMQPALTGMSSSGQAATIIAAAIQAFWVAAATPAGFPPAIAVVPPPNAGLAALLSATFTSNTSGDLSLAAAANTVATDMYNQAIIGGTALIPPPPAGTSYPIL